jgi:hypothetical protein
MTEWPSETHLHLAAALHPTPRVLRRAMGDVDGFNAKFAVLITRLVGTMWCAYLFTIIALLGLSPALKPGGEGLIAWIAQTFLQLVLLSVIMVGQNVQSIASDKRAEGTYDDAVEILDRLDVSTKGGIADLKVALEQRIDAIEASLATEPSKGTSVSIADLKVTLEKRLDSIDARLATAPSKGTSSK